MSEKLDKSLKKFEVSITIIILGSLFGLAGLEAAAGGKPFELIGTIGLIAGGTFLFFAGAIKLADVYVEWSYKRKANKSAVSSEEDE